MACCRSIAWHTVAIVIIALLIWNPVTVGVDTFSLQVAKEEMNQDLNTRSCIRNENDCVGKKTGDYQACRPECERGVYYTCNENVGYRRQCGFGYYTYPNGTRYTARMVFVQESDTCQLRAAYCPRVPQNYSEVSSNPDVGVDTFSLQVAKEETNLELSQHSCIRDENGCAGKRTGDYRACRPECESGVYYTCNKNFGYRRQCGFGYYTYPNGTRYTARLVFVEESDTCQFEATYCPRIPQNASEVLSSTLWMN